MTVAIRRTSKEKLYHEVGLESLQLRRWFKKVCYLYKFYKHESPQYLFKLVPLRQSPYATRNTENIPLFKTKHNFFKNSFFPQLLSNGTILTIACKTSKALVLLKTIF